MSQTTQKKFRKFASRSGAGVEGGAAFANAENPLTTIVEYTDQKRPQNAYPARIVSPPRSGACCFTDMEEIGEPQQEGRWVYQYRRCRKCGFALRVILREIPDEALAAELRRTLANSFVRNVPD
ncbi:MAG: hypothetical protein WC713_05280 [Candidatus Methylomirabilota bacterium]